MNDKIKAIAKIVASVLLSLLVILCVYTFVMTDILKKDYVNVLGYSYFVVGSGSMSDAIEVNDIVFVKITKDVEINDIVTYKSVDNIIVTHRLISIDKGKYILKGDANNVSDDPILQDQIIGKVNLVISPMFVLKCIAVFLILFIFLALINFDAIFNRFIAKEKIEEKKKEPHKEEKGVSTKDNYQPVTRSINAKKEFASEDKKIVEDKKEKIEEKKEPIVSNLEILDENPIEEKKEVKIEKNISTKKIEEKPTISKKETVEEKPTISKKETVEEKPIIEKPVVDTSKFIEVPKVVSDEIFMSPEKRKNEEMVSGLTVTISLDEIEDLKRLQELEESRLSDMEILEDIEFLDKKVNEDDDDLDLEVDPEKDLMELVLSILKTKNRSIKKSRMNAKWIKKFQYIYQLNLLLLDGRKRDFVQSVEKPSFKEIYDYDLDGAGLTDYVRYKIFDMPVHVYLRVLTYSILYNDEELFDGIFKIFKYRVLLDKNYLYVDIKKMDNHRKAGIKSLVKFMKKVPEKYDKKEVFELDKIERIVKIKGY